MRAGRGTRVCFGGRAPGTAALAAVPSGASAQPLTSTGAAALCGSLHAACEYVEAPGTVPSCLRGRAARAGRRPGRASARGAGAGFVITKTAPIQLVSSHLWRSAALEQAGLRPTVSCAAPRAMTPAPALRFAMSRLLVRVSQRTRLILWRAPSGLGARWRHALAGKTRARRRAPAGPARTGDTGAASAALALALRA